jgi:hypothetical protein
MLVSSSEFRVSSFELKADLKAGCASLSRPTGLRVRGQVLGYGCYEGGESFRPLGLGNNFGQEAPPHLEQEGFGLAAAVGQVRRDQTCLDGQVPQTLDNIEKPDILGALKRTMGAAQTVPKGRGG